jgi:hypothetical protein
LAPLSGDAKRFPSAALLLLLLLLLWHAAVFSDSAPPEATMQTQPHQPPYAVQLDADRARGLAANGAAVLLLGVPTGTVIGVDHRVFVAGPRFRGVKMLPPGLHALTYQAVGGGGSGTASGSGRDPDSSISAGAAAAGASAGAGAAPAVSLWLWLKPREVVVRRWAPADEALVPLDDDDEVRARVCVLGGGHVAACEKHF